MINIPLESKNKDDFPLKKAERMIVAYAVLFGADNRSAFMRFHPEYVSTDGKTMNQAGNQASRQFWSWGKVKDYRAAYEETVQEFLSGRKRAVRITDSDDNVSSDKRKDRAIRKLVSDCLDAIENNAALDPETLKDFVTMAKALGVLKDEEEQQIAPIRVLIARCKSECNYCFFVETAKAKGLMFDSCDYCKARKVAEEHGFKFDHCTLLDVPQEVIEEIESHNDVKLTDILDNGQMTRVDIEKQFNDIDSGEQDN